MAGDRRRRPGNPGAFHVDTAKRILAHQGHEATDTDVQEIKGIEQVGEQTEDTNSISTLITLSSSKAYLYWSRDRVE